MIAHKKLLGSYLGGNSCVAQVLKSMIENLFEGENYTGETQVENKAKRSNCVNKLINNVVCMRFLLMTKNSNCKCYEMY